MAPDVCRHASCPRHSAKPLPRGGRDGRGRIVRRRVSFHERRGGAVGTNLEHSDPELQLTIAEMPAPLSEMAL